MKRSKPTLSVSFVAVVLVAFLALYGNGCMVGPNYRRPQVSTPPAYRGDDGKTSPAASQSGASLGDLKWHEVFQDPVLQNLIQTALKQNYDLQIAATRILQAEAQLGVTRSQQFPQVNGTASGVRQKTAAEYSLRRLHREYVSIGRKCLLDAGLLGTVPAGNRGGASLSAGLAVRAGSGESDPGFRAGEQLFPTAGARSGLKDFAGHVEVAAGLLAADRDQGAGRGVLHPDVRQAESLVETAQTTITDTERSIKQTEDAISTFLGQNPGSIARGKPLDDIALEPMLPAGMPSALLERRPDIRQAEEQLVAANAEIGVARAAFFPQIALTGSGGAESFQLSKLFTSGIWSYAGDLSQPIFTAGRLKANLRLASTHRDEAVLTYKKTIQEAFREVSDALIGYEQNRQFLAEQQTLTKTLADADQLSRVRYQGGVTSYLEVLQQETQYFSSQLGLAQTRLSEFTSVVQLYQALGGGWQ
ncbi:MAG: efflux transporter outer membrane subunit [Bryobacteraceae bacterium]